MAAFLFCTISITFAPLINILLLKSVFIHKTFFKQATISVIGCLVLTMSGCKPSPKEAADYNLQIINEQSLIVEKIDFLEKTLGTYRPTEMDYAYNDVIKQINKSIDKVNAMEAFDSKTDYKDATIQVFEIYREVVENEYKEIVTLFKKSEDDYTLEDEQRAKVLFKNISEKLNNAYEDIIAVQGAFAKKYRITLKK